MATGLGALNVLESKTLADLIYEAVRKAIVSGELLPGSRLRETELASRMHVSRTPVREALCRLESVGMIEYIPRRGMVIRGFNTHEAHELFTMRIGLEPLAAEQAVSHLQSEQIQQLIQLLERMKATARHSRELDFYQLSRSFSDILLQAAGMPMLLNAVNTCQECLLRYRQSVGEQIPTAETRLFLLRQVRGRMAIMRALLSHDGKAAGQWLRYCLERERDACLQILGGV
jgi:DNA-binding GntR family transcriptional regulator